MKSKSLLFSLFAILLLVSSCKTYKESMANAKVDPISKKLPAMMISWKNSQMQNHTNAWTTIIPTKQLVPLKASLFSELKTNCMDEVTDSVAGSIQVELIDGSYSINVGLLLMSIWTCYSTTLLGAPFDRSKLKTDVRISVLDLEGKPVKSYRYALKKSSVQGLYYGKTSKVTSSLLGSDIAKQFKQDLEKDADYISSKLLTKTYYPFGTEAGKHVLKAIDYCQDGNYKQSLIEISEARYCDDITEYTQNVADQVYEVASAARQQQLEQRAQAWAAVGAAVAAAGTSTAAAVASSNSKSSSVSSSRMTSRGTVSSSSSSYSGSDNEDSSSTTREKQKTMKECPHCNGTGQTPNVSIHNADGPKSYCSVCGCEEPKHTHMKCKICDGKGEVFDKYK